MSRAVKVRFGLPRKYDVLVDEIFEIHSCFFSFLSAEMKIKRQYGGKRANGQTGKVYPVYDKVRIKQERK